MDNAAVFALVASLGLTLSWVTLQIIFQSSHKLRKRMRRVKCWIGVHAPCGTWDDVPGPGDRCDICSLPKHEHGRGDERHVFVDTTEKKVQRCLYCDKVVYELQITKTNYAGNTIRRVR